jgi:hypothetical protein
MTAAERLKQLSGLSGVSAAVMLMSLAAGVTTGDTLVNYSSLPTATAAQHLLADRQTSAINGNNIYRVLPETRLVVASSDSRVFAVPSELRSIRMVVADRAAGIPAADRSCSVFVEVRSLAVPAESRANTVVVADRILAISPNVREFIASPPDRTEAVSEDRIYLTNTG